MSIAEPVQFVRITDDTTRAELLETLTLLTADAERLSRQGIAFVRDNAEYRRIHARIDALCAELEVMN